MLTPKQRASVHLQPPVRLHVWPATLQFEECLDVARRTMVCGTCAWALHEPEPCAEQQFVQGCIHWKRRGT